MSRDKQALLKRHRRQKRLWGAACLLCVLATGLAHWALPLLLALLLWIAHEAWGSDHLFYSPRQDYRYRFDAAKALRATVSGGMLRSNEALPEGGTLILEITVDASLAGRFFDPHAAIGGERFDFERGCSGKRYLDVSAHRLALSSGGVPIVSRHCTVSPEASLSAFEHPDFSQRRLMIVAPHADDAELAAFGLYRSSPEPLIVTLTQGEAEAEALATSLGLDITEAARLKGRLRSWDSVCVPRWAGVPAGNCVQLGYYCMQLREMRLAPGAKHASPYSGDDDIRPARQWNSRRLPADENGCPTWDNLIADLIALIEDFEPELIVMPHPRLDPHPDHVAATQALRDALGRCKARPEYLLLYANHLHDNDRWPMGPAGGGVTLPPSFDELSESRFWSIPLTGGDRIDKSMALGMNHDLQGRLPAKKRLRRTIQTLLAGREWPGAGENEYFRKAVRSRELFWVIPSASFLGSHENPS